MSYSFSVRGATKADVIEKVKAELGKVVALQPVHAADCDQAQATAEAILSVVPAADGKDFAMSVNGYVSWTGNLGEADQVLIGASVGASVSLVDAE